MVDKNLTTCCWIGLLIVNHLFLLLVLVHFKKYLLINGLHWGTPWKYNNEKM